MMQRTRADSGQAMIEFVLAFPIVLLLIMGIIEFSALANAHQVVQYAAHNAARAQMTGQNAAMAAAISCVAISPSSVSGLDPGRIVPDFILNLLDKVTGIRSSGQKMLYSYLLVNTLTGIETHYYDADNKEVAGADKATYLETVVTYYYPLKFPVINVIADFVARQNPGPIPLPWPWNDNVFYYTDSRFYTQTKWAECAALYKLTSVKFVPVVKNCYMDIL